MEVSYKRDFHHSYLILKDQKIPDCDDYAIRMLLNSSIPGLLACTVHKIDNQAFFYYEITSKQPLAWILENQKIDREMLVLVIGALMRVIEEIEAYLLNPKTLILDPEHIYVNMADQEVGFICWPGNEQDCENFFQLMEYLLPRIDHEDQEAVVLGYQLYRRAMEDQADPEEIRKALYQEVLQPEKPKAMPKFQEESIQEESFTQQEVLETVLKNVKEEERKEHNIYPGICMGMIVLLVVFYMYLMRNQFFSWVLFAVIAGVFALGSGIAAVIWRLRKRKKQKGESLVSKVADMVSSCHKSEEELPDIMEEAQTTLLFAPTSERCARLQAVRPEDLEDISLKQGVQILGKMAGAADIVLPSSAVSRIHAKISLDEECMIFDLNSKNGTYVNQESVLGTEGKVLKEGDVVALADLIYRYTEKASDLQPHADSTIMGEEHCGRHVNGRCI